jgi:hypothetical protein
MKIRKLTAAFLLGTLGFTGLTACSSQADTVSENLSKDADSFKIDRRIVFYNGITGGYILEVQGRCSVGNNDGDGRLSVTCKTGKDEYKKHFLGLSDNVTFFAEQLEGAYSDPFHYKVIFKPEEIIPDVDFQKSGG